MLVINLETGEITEFDDSAMGGIEDYGWRALDGYGHISGEKLVPLLPQILASLYRAQKRGNQ